MIRVTDNHPAVIQSHPEQQQETLFKEDHLPQERTCRFHSRIMIVSIVSIVIIVIVL
jgi:hypothetical protein